MNIPNIWYSCNIQEESSIIPWMFWNIQNIPEYSWNDGRFSVFWSNILEYSIITWMNIALYRNDGMFILYRIFMCRIMYRTMEYSMIVYRKCVMYIHVCDQHIYTLHSCIHVGAMQRQLHICTHVEAILCVTYCIRIMMCCRTGHECSNVHSHTATHCNILTYIQTEWINQCIHSFTFYAWPILFYAWPIRYEV